MREALSQPQSPRAGAPPPPVVGIHPPFTVTNVGQCPYPRSGAESIASWATIAGGPGLLRPRHVPRCPEAEARTWHAHRIVRRAWCGNPGAHSLPRDSNVGYPIDIRKPEVNHRLHRSLRSPKGWLPMRPLRPRRAITLRARGARTVPPQTHVRRALALALAGVLVFAAPAASLDRPERRLAAMTNTARYRHHVPRLVEGARLSAAAERRSLWMAKSGRLSHGSLAWTSGCGCWGQNVGKGPTVRAVFRAFMRSADHRANMLDRCYRRAGYGVVKIRGAVWVTVNFAG
jgi:hypothetical protein